MKTKNKGKKQLPNTTIGGNKYKGPTTHVKTKKKKKTVFLHVFSFLHKLSFENSFCFLSILGYQTSFLVSKIEIFFFENRK